MFFDMKRNIIGLIIWGILMIVSAISGISSYWTSSQGVSVTYYHSIFMRGLIAVSGGFLIYVSWGIYNRQMLAWRTYFLVQTLAWITFVSLGHLKDR
jgi:hypothetical protein